MSHFYCIGCKHPVSICKCEHPVVRDFQSLIYDLASLQAQLLAARQVKCPHCGEIQGNIQGDTEWLGENDLITFLGESGKVKVQCSDCEKEFHVEESVTRTYEVTP